MDVKLPNAIAAIVDRAKVVDYLLSRTHSQGRHKAAFFVAFGFSASRWQKLADALARHAAESDVARTEVTPFGTRYIVEGALAAADGRTPALRSVWFIEFGAAVPRFVTAYPLKRIER